MQVQWEYEEASVSTEPVMNSGAFSALKLYVYFVQH